MSQLVFVIGPPGAGKTTALKALAALGETVLPTNPRDNPYLSTAWSDGHSAYRSQVWFASRPTQLVSALARDTRRVFIEDDPRLAPHAHTAALEDAGRLSAAQCRELRRIGDSVLTTLQTAGNSLAWVMLDAADDVLLARQRARDGVFPGDRSWLAFVAEELRTLAARFAVSVIHTDALAPGEVAQSIQLVAVKSLPTA